MFKLGNVSRREDYDRFLFAYSNLWRENPSEVIVPRNKWILLLKIRNRHWIVEAGNDSTFLERKRDLEHIEIA